MPHAADDPPGSGCQGAAAPGAAPSPPVGAPALLILVLVYLVPVWAFPYVPTQDGPAHLANAVLLVGSDHLGAPGRALFESRWAPVPNWTCQLLLAALLHSVSPLVAEKVLVTLYVVGFLCASRYLVGAFGRADLPLANIALLLAFNRCFLMGFYNACFGLVLDAWILGYMLRRQGRLSLSDAAALAPLFGLTYFTHLLGFSLAIGGAFWLAALSPGARTRNILAVGAACFPTLGLALCTGLLHPDLLGLHTLLQNQQGRACPLGSLRFDVSSAFDAANDGLFAPYQPGHTVMGPLVLAFFEALGIATALQIRSPAAKISSVPSRRPVAFLALVATLLFVVLPDTLSPIVAFLHTRLIPAVALLWLASVRLPARSPWRWTYLAFGYGLLGLNLAFIVHNFAVTNATLKEFNAGIAQAGTGRVLFVVQRWSGPALVDPLAHAADYYCLTTGNVNLDNYQAELAHFPIRFRSGVRRGRNDWAGYPQRALVDIVLVWDWPAPFDPGADFVEVFRGGRLRIFRRKANLTARDQDAKKGANG